MGERLARPATGASAVGYRSADYTGGSRGKLGATSTHSPIPANSAAAIIRTARNGMRSAAALPMNAVGRVHEQHAERRARDDGRQRIESGGEHRGGDLRLVAHLRQEERDDGDDEHAAARRGRRVVVGELVRLERPQLRPRRTTVRAPSAAVRRQFTADPGPTQPASVWLNKRRHENAGDDRPRLAVRAASTRVRSWVLSPSSPMATTTVETSSASSMG